ncbi:DNA-binding protein [Janthinobacterium lividum]|uniref:DNA-binding protein n=1 Tax=Janthinobacterium lividum TaxID=29581 RepID=UPI00140A120F|nr:DNA-binding protein [Janthinobacterium lividum]NHQ94288.1 integrase [Janthinobacterium lividum]
MSRTGLYPSDVRKARDSLLAQGRHPSVDAVRVALGNTGSKTTIHKYLKEFEAKEGVVNGRSVAVSDALQDLVARLAARLHEEADLRADAALVDSTEEARRQAQIAQKLQQDLEAARRCERDLTESLATERDMHEETKAALQRETILRHTAEQQAAGLKDRLIENEQHRASLEDKHAHARSALEHYRQSAKEQRDQEQRRHEQQLQQVQAELRLQQQALVAKQEEGGRLNQDATRLVVELSHVKQSLYEQVTLVRKQVQTIERLQSLQVQVPDLERQLVGKMVEIDILSQDLAATKEQITPTAERVRELEVALTQAEAREQARQEIDDQMRSYLEFMKRGLEGEKPGA